MEKRNSAAIYKYGDKPLLSMPNGILVAFFHERVNLHHPYLDIFVFITNDH